MQVVELAEHGQQRSGGLDEVHDHPGKAAAGQGVGRDVGAVLGHVVARGKDHVDLEPHLVTQLGRWRENRSMSDVKLL